MECQASEVGETGALEGKLHGIFIAEEIFHRIDVILLGIAGQSETELPADVGNLGPDHRAIAIRGIEVLYGTGTMEVDTAERSGSAVLEDVGVGLSQERQTGGQQFIGLWRKVILIVDVRLRHIEHFLAVLIDRVVALLVLEVNLQVTVVGQFRM